MLVFRDALVAIIVALFVVFGSAVVISTADTGHNLPKMVCESAKSTYFNHRKGPCGSVTVFPGKRFEFLYFGAALIALFFLVGLCSSLKCCCAPPSSYASGEGEAGSGPSGDIGVSVGCDGGSAEGGLLLVAVLFVVLVFAGVFVAIFYGVYMAQHSINRHLNVLQMQVMAEEYRVLDRSEWLDNDAIDSLDELLGVRSREEIC
jgi:hypothetical protein